MMMERMLGRAGDVIERPPTEQTCMATCGLGSSRGTGGIGLQLIGSWWQSFPALCLTTECKEVVSYAALTFIETYFSRIKPTL